MGVIAALMSVAVVAGSGAASVTGRAAAASSEPALTIKALDREGNTVKVTASVQSAASPDVDDLLTSGHATAVPPGTYNVAAWVWEPGGKAATLVDRALTITSSRTLVLDARPGRQVRFTVNDSSVWQDAVLAEPFSLAAGRPAFDNGSYGPIQGATVYVVPGTMPTGWNLLLQADLIRHRATPTSLSPVEYDLVRVLPGTIPAHLIFATSKASLAREHVVVRAIDPGGLEGASVEPVDQGTAASWIMLAATPFGQPQVRAPFAVDFYVTAGFRWNTGATAVSGYSGTATSGRPVIGGHSYMQTFNRAVFGPYPEFGPGVYQDEILTDPSFGNFFLADPSHASTSTGIFPINAQGWIYQGSKLLAHSTGYGNRVTARVSATPKWYTLRIQAVRTSGSGQVLRSALAQSLSGSFTFQAWANDSSLAASVFWPRLIPGDLSTANAAQPGTKTTIPITFDTQTGAIAVHGVAVWASVNGGQTWTALTVSNTGHSWSVTVRNPAHAGFVSLRVKGTSAAGFSASVTAINAYRVS